MVLVGSIVSQNQINKVCTCVVVWLCGCVSVFICAVMCVSDIRNTGW